MGLRVLALVSVTSSSTRVTAAPPSKSHSSSPVASLRIASGPWLGRKPTRGPPIRLLGSCGRRPANLGFYSTPPDAGIKPALGGLLGTRKQASESDSSQSDDIRVSKEVTLSVRMQSRWAPREQHQVKKAHPQDGKEQVESKARDAMYPGPS